MHALRSSTFDAGQVTDLSAHAEALLMAAQAEGEAMVILRFDGQRLYVHCQRSADVEPLCRYVLDRPDEARTLQ